VQSGERVATEIVRAAWGIDPRPLFNQLAARILRISGAPPGERPDLVAQTTHSLEAYQAYLAGVAHLQHFRIDSARAHLERAIALDSTFALAYVRLRDAVGWETSSIGNPELRRELIAQAQRYSGSLPPRLRTLIQFHAAYEDGDFARARDIASGMIERDSTDVEAWYQLGEAHFHDLPVGLPAQPNRGNIGIALSAFQRALELDSSYSIAYEHILNGLNLCATPNNGILCLADSAVYGMPQELSTSYGDTAVEHSKAAARAEQTTTARAWVSIDPNLARARQALALALIGEEEWHEAEQQVDELRTLGAQAQAAGLQAVIAANLGDYGEAGWWLSRGLAVGDTVATISASSVQQLATNLFAGSGRVAEAVRFGTMFFNMIPLDSLPGPGGLMYPKDDILALLRLAIAVQTGFPPDTITARAHAWLDIVDRRAGDSATRWTGYVGSGPAVLLAYQLEGDTTLLTRVVDAVNGAPMSEAYLALERGDTVFARAGAIAATGANGAGAVDTAMVPEGPQRLVWAMGWGELLARLGRLEDAAAVYAYADSVDHPVSSPGVLVRSWAERAAILQRLGRVTEAITLYQRYIDAWEDADPGLQPLVERARQSIAALQGAVESPRR
jgi:tetratricopeptide (TPR) repeat protein